MCVAAPVTWLACWSLKRSPSISQKQILRTILDCTWTLSERSPYPVDSRA